MVDGLIRNLIAGGLADRGGGSDTILELGVEPNSILQNQLVRCGLALIPSWN
jgi:hypothetical protein